MSVESRIAALAAELARQKEANTRTNNRLERMEEHLDALYHQMGLRRLGHRPKVKA